MPKFAPLFPDPACDTKSCLPHKNWAKLLKALPPSSNPFKNLCMPLAKRALSKIDRIKIVKKYKDGFVIPEKYRSWPCQI